MVMSKAEKAEMEALRTRLALRWPSMEEPEAMTVERQRELAKVQPERVGPELGARRRVLFGWSYNAHSGWITRIWTDGSSCGSVSEGDRLLGGSRTMRPFFMDKQSAALAMWWETAREMAKKMRAAERHYEETVDAEAK